LLTVVVLAVLQASLAVPEFVALVYPALFVLVIVTTGIFLSAREVLGTVLVMSAITVWYYLYSDASAVLPYRAAQPQALNLFMVTLLILFMGAGALSWLSSRMMRETLAALHHRAVALETAYRELAEQTEREHALGSNISSLAVQLSTVSTRQVHGVGTQARAITQVVSAVGELHAAANQITSIAQQVSLAAAAALESVNHAQALVAHSREVVERNRTQVVSAIERMTILDQLTERITRFINGIRDLSDETQLLSLNATIEAAGAGPLGRRFGVVAGEVQTLARRSDSLVEEIRMALVDLRAAGQTALATTQSGLQVADEVQQVADEVRQAQAQVVSVVEQTNSLIQLIAAATAQQNIATEQVTETMHQIAANADTTTQESQALETVSGELARAADALMSAMARLRPAVQG
jgi:methyl-accepting chemotaxis protein